MKQIIKTEKYGEIIYNENFWTGTKTLSINGVPANKTSKNTFVTTDNKTCTLLGNYATGVKLNIDNETFTITPNLKWYEIVLSLLPFILIIVWGSSITLCKIIPIVGGAIGGAISGLTSIINLIIIKNVKNIWFKILISIGMLAVTFGICYLVALLILSSI